MGEFDRLFNNINGSSNEFDGPFKNLSGSSNEIYLYRDNLHKLL
jgi:hypothetical protein